MFEVSVDYFIPLANLRWAWAGQADGQLHAALVADKADQLAGHFTVSRFGFMGWLHGYTAGEFIGTMVTSPVVNSGVGAPACQ